MSMDATKWLTVYIWTDVCEEMSAKKNRRSLFLFLYVDLSLLMCYWKSSALTLVFSNGVVAYLKQLWNKGAVPEDWHCCITYPKKLLLWN